MRPRLLALLVVAALALLGAGCNVFYPVAKFVGVMGPEKFSARGEIPPDFRMGVSTIDYADPPTDYTIVIERTGKVTYDVVVRTPHRRQQTGTFEITEQQVVSMWKAVAAAKFDELDERYPSSGDGKDTGLGVRKWFVRADGLERRVEAHRQSVPEMEPVRTTFLGMIPKDVMTAHDAMIGRNTSGEYMGDTATKVFHLPDCPMLKDVPAQRKQTFGSQYDALNYNFQPCPECAPLRAKSR